MAAQESLRNNNQEATTQRAAHATPMAAMPSRPLGADPEDMLLLREKLNQIAVGRRYGGDNQLDHLMDDDDCTFESGSAARRRPSPRGQYRSIYSSSDRPSTPPSSPQPRDVLRKQLRLKTHSPFYAPQRALEPEPADGNNSDSASDEPLEGMCVDTVEISPLPATAVIGGERPPHATVRLSVPAHLRVRSSSYSVLTKCPEGFRKRKSVHIDDKDLAADGHSVVAPLKKVSSQVNVLSGTRWADCSSKSAAMEDAAMDDAGPDPSDSPPE